MLQALLRMALPTAAHDNAAATAAVTAALASAGAALASE